MNRLVSLFPLLIAALLAAGSVWLQYIVQDERSTAQANQRHDPDATASHFTIERFSNSGRLQSSLTAESMRHYPDTDSAEIDKPTLILHTEKGPMTWTSTSATAYNASNTVDMRGRVQAYRPASPGNEALTLKTEALSLDMDNEIARATAPIVVTQGASILEGRRAQWDNINGLLTIQSARATLPRKTPAP